MVVDFLCLITSKIKGRRKRAETETVAAFGAARLDFLL